MTRVLSPARFAQALVVAGVALALLGMLPWVAVAVGADGADDWPLLVLAGVAVLGGAFIALVGAGMLRQARARQRQLAEQALDDAALQTAEAADPDTCGADCATCTTSCALQELRA